MRKHTVAITLAAWLLIALQAMGSFNAQYIFQNWTQTTTGVSVKTVEITGLWTITINNQTNVVPGLGAVRRFANNAQASLTVSNMIPGAYGVRLLDGTTVIAAFTNVFGTNVTGTVNAADYISVPTNTTSSFDVAYTQAAANALFVFKAGDTMGAGGLTNPVGIAGGNGILRLDTSSAFNTFLNAGTGSAKVQVHTGGVSLFDVAGVEGLTLVPSSISLKKDTYVYSNLFGASIIASNGFSGNGASLSNLTLFSYANTGAAGSNVFKQHLENQIDNQSFPFIPIGVTTWEANGTAISNITLTNIMISVSNLTLNTIAAKYGGIWVNIDDGWQTNDLINGHVFADPNKFPNLTNTMTWLHTWPNVKAIIYTEPGTHSSSGLAGAGTNLITFAQDMFNFGLDGIHLDQPAVTTQPMIENAQVMMTSFRGYASNKLSIAWFGSVWAGTNAAVESSVPPGSIIRVHNDWGSYITSGAGNWTNFFLQDLLFRIDTFPALANAYGRDRWVMSGALFSAIPNLPTVEQVIVGWYAMTAQPMFFTHLSTYTGNALLTNKNIYLIQQDPLRDRARQLPANTNVWVKRLSDGGVAVGFLNRSTNTSTSIGVTWPEIGFDPTDVMDVINVWGLTSTTATGTLTNSTASMSMDIFLIRPVRPLYLAQARQWPIVPFDAAGTAGTQPGGGYGFVMAASGAGFQSQLPAEMFQNGRTNVVSTYVVNVRSNAFYKFNITVNGYSRTNRFTPTSVDVSFTTGFNNNTNVTISATNVLNSPDGTILGAQAAIFFYGSSVLSSPTNSAAGYIQGTAEAR